MHPLPRVGEDVNDEVMLDPEPSTSLYSCVVLVTGREKRRYCSGLLDIFLENKILPRKLWVCYWVTLLTLIYLSLVRSSLGERTGNHVIAFKMNTNNDQSGVLDEMNGDVKQITTQHDERRPVRITYDDPKSLPYRLGAGARDNRLHTIKDIIGRPIPLYKALWQSTSVAGTVVMLSYLPQDPLSYVMNNVKVSGFLGFKADFVIRLQVNGNRFQQGRLMLGFVPGEPYYNAVPALQVDPRAALTLNSLSRASQTLRKDFDIATDTDVSIRIPWYSKKPYFDTINYNGSLGYAFVMVYDPLTSASTELFAEMTLWVEMENIDLQYPTVPGPNFLAQSGDIGDDEKEIEGPISSTLGVVSDVLPTLARIPLLSTYVKPAMWMTNMLRNAAFSFGLSKPNNEVSEMMMPKHGFGMANCDVKDGGQSMALTAANRIIPMNGVAGTEVDEMAIQFITSIPSYWTTVNWSVTATSGTLLANYPLGPDFWVLSTNVTYNGVTIAQKDFMPFSYMSQAFDRYRGSLGLRLKLVKTEFHSGRLRIAFQPGPLTSMGQSMDCTPYEYTEVWDIRNSSEFTICPPFSSVAPYLPNNRRYGTILIFVQNELRAPDTVTNSINMLVEVFGGPDLEFAVPKPLQMVPYCPTASLASPAPTQTKITNVSSNSIVAQSDFNFVAQVGEVEVVDECDGRMANCDTPPATSHIGRNDVTMAGFCVGERLMSLKQLLLRACPVIYPGNVPSIANDLTIPADVLQWDCVGSTPLTWIGIDYYTYFSALFRFHRGGFRWKAYPVSNAVSGIRAAVYVQGFSPNNSVPKSVSQQFMVNTTGLPLVYTGTTSNPVLEFQVPYYGDHHVRYTPLDFNGYTGVVTNAPNPDYSRCCVSFRSPDGLSNYIFARSVADDYFLHGFISTVPCLYTAVTESQSTPANGW
jgi:hypothetical protein